MKQDHSPFGSARGETADSHRLEQEPADGGGDPYKRPSKLSEPALCRNCGAVFHNGRWQQGSPSINAEPTLCQACHREEDNFPAGLMVLSGTYLAAHSSEVVELIRREAELERSAHPFNRIMSLEQTAPERLIVATTDIHLPHRIGEALKRAHQGKLFVDFDKDSYFVRVEWRRDLQ